MSAPGDVSRAAGSAGPGGASGSGGSRDAGGLSRDRVAGALVGLAAGDALGAGYEFTTPAPDAEIVMKGGGPFGFDPGEWTDDTQMAVCIAEVTATGTLDPLEVAARFIEWYRSAPKDVGAMTSAVLGAVRDPRALADAARAYHERHPRGSAGNGSLMRTAPVALANLGDDEALVAAAREISALTHADPLAQDACAIWCVAIDRAVREGRVDGAWDGVELLEPRARDRWSGWLEEAETRDPATFTPNGYVVTALQAAHASVVRAVAPGCSTPGCALPAGLKAAVRIGHDTDTVAAIAGQVLGARHGLTAVPFAWRRVLHGWPGHRVRDLVRLAVLTAQGGRSDGAGWPAVGSVRGHYEEAGVARPAAQPLDDDPGLVVGNAVGIEAAVADHGADAVVSLCRIGPDDVPSAVAEHHEVMLADSVDANANLDLVLRDTVEAIATLRAEGRTVFLHCAAGMSRTPTVAALYLARRLGIPGDEALARVHRVIPDAPWNPTFRDAIHRAEGIIGACVCDHGPDGSGREDGERP